MMKLSLSVFQSLPRPVLKFIAAGLLIPATLDSGFDPAKFDAFLLFVASLYAIRGGEKVAAIIKSEGGAGNG